MNFFLIALVALVISIIALIYTIRIFYSKRGNKIKGDITIGQWREFPHWRINSLLLENKKDKSIIILEIYVILGNNNYLLLEDLNNSPLIIKPFECYQNKYNIKGYAVNMKKVEINPENFKSRNVKIMIRTPNENILVNQYKNFPLLPIIKSLKNRSINLVYPSYSDYHYNLCEDPIMELPFYSWIKTNLIYRITSYIQDIRMEKTNKIRGKIEKLEIRIKKLESKF